MQRLLSKAAKVGIVEQADWATPGTASSTFELVYVDSGSLNFNPDVNISGFDHTSGVGLLPERARQYSDSLSGLPRVKFTMPATRRNLALFFAGALHKSTEVASTPYQKVITPLYETEVPDFYNAANKEPHLFTIALVQDGTTLGHGLLRNAVVNSLIFKIDFNARGVARFAQIEVEFVGIAWEGIDDWSGATFTTTTQDFYNQNTQCVIGEDTLGADLPIKTFELSINNNVDSDVKTTYGVASDYVLNNPEIMATITTADVSSRGSYEINSVLKNGTEQVITLAHGTTGVAGFLEIALKGRMMNNDFLTHENGYDGTTLQIRCEKPASGSCCTVTIADAVDRNWIAP